ncbi:MAG TPA: sulfotransferase domain-containing protein [Gammaproteobacteria bacterium]
MASEPVFIAGMYKSGTSWLLRILDRHPAFRGVKEIDLIGAGAGRAADGDALLPAPERLAGYFARNAWGALPKDLQGDAEGAALLKRATGGDTVEALFALPPPTAAAALFGLYGLKRRRGSSDWESRDQRELLNAADLGAPALEQLYAGIAGAADVYQAADLFIETVAAPLEQGQTLVLKGADMIARYAHLKAWRPRARKLVIVRDGRDAAISAVHFRRLMRSIKRAHVDAQNDYWELLAGWASRIRMLQQAAGDGQLAILRYEDLQQDFPRVARKLFGWLGADTDPALLRDVYEATRFETLTGRARGEAAEHVIRRGITGEWREALSGADQERAWHEAGKELAALGYTPSGGLDSLPLPGAL